MKIGRVLLFLPFFLSVELFLLEDFSQENVQDGRKRAQLFNQYHSVGDTGVECEKNLILNPFQNGGDQDESISIGKCGHRWDLNSSP